ncbi:MAG: hypothetical protein HGA72_10655, partial [Chlorobiaceae bacterium]|nr:hypothetical protein [Chlorobiaceae bacterium]
VAALGVRVDVVIIVIVIREVVIVVLGRGGGAGKEPADRADDDQCEQSMKS